ncbi:hypothetical protein PMAYCL1PPCAC_23274, partial [Pristionchus mayeri]
LLSTGNFQMESEFKNLQINKTPSSTQKRPLESNVYKVRTAESCVVHRYIVKLERSVVSGKGAVKKHLTTSGPDPLRIIKSSITRAAIHHMLSVDEYKDGTFVYDLNDKLYSNVVLTDSELTKEIPVSSLNVSTEEKRIVLHDSKSIFVTLKSDGGLSNIPSKINSCDCEDNDIINFYSSLLKSAAPTDKFIQLRGGKLFDITTLKLIGYGIERAKGVKLGTKLIGKEELSIAVDVDGKEGSFYKPQSLLWSILDYFECSEDQLRREFGNYNKMKKLERFIRGTPARLETTDRVFTISGLMWEGEEGRRYLLKWSQVRKSEDLSKYDNDPVVMEVNVNEGKFTYTYYPLSSLHLLPYTRVPLSKQDRINPPKHPPADVRYVSIKEARANIKIDHQNSNLKGFSTEIATRPVYPMSEILPAPTISAPRNGQMSALNVDPIKHHYDSNPFQFVVPAHIRRFQVVYDVREIKEEEARKFFDQIIEVCRQKGLTADKASFCGVGEEEELKNGLKSLEAGSIVIAIGFKNDHDSLKFLEYKWKVVNQHVMKRSVLNIIKASGKETLHNIVKKINEKCGGSNIEVQSPAECASLFPSRTDPNAGSSLIVGMDVCHGDPISNYLLLRGFKPDPSIIGMYTGDFIPTQGRRESVPDAVMSDHGKYLMEKFRLNHGRLPDNVILVRDGVSKSQYDMALSEFAAFMEGVRSVTSADYSPREMLIIVTKEHNIRLFDKVNGRICNPMAGTLVDSEIVSPFRPEFLLIPHNAFAGTAKAILVTVLKGGEKDLRKFPSDALREIEFFIHSLCFLHGICDKPPGSPEPVSVAHDLAERGMNLAKELKFRTGEQLSVNELERELRARGTAFEGVKITA